MAKGGSDADQPFCHGSYFDFVAGAFAQPEIKSACDSACLKNYVDRYMDAMLAKDVSLKLFARECRFTENGVRLPLGNEWLWFDMSGKGTYKFYIPDVETGQIAFIGTAREKSSDPRAKASGSAPAAKSGESAVVAIALRLKILNGLINEIFSASVDFDRFSCIAMRNRNYISPNRRECREDRLPEQGIHRSHP